MLQQDLFAADTPVETLDLPAVLERLADISPRPRYTFMVLNLIARAAGAKDSVGPYVSQAGAAIPIRDWLSDALLPMAQRDARRRAVVAQVRANLAAGGRRYATGCGIPVAPTLAARSPIWFAPDWFAGIIRATG